jgi:hypothetical protein
MDPYCGQYKSTICLIFSLTAQLSNQEVFDDDQTHLETAQTQILCLIIYALGLL